MPTITTDTTITSVALNEAFSVNNGAIGTINRPLYTNFWNTWTINDGEIHVDGTKIFRVQLTSVTNFAVGQTLTSGSVSGEIVEVTGNFVQYLVLSGDSSIANGATVTSTGGGNTTATADSTVGFFIVYYDSSDPLNINAGTWRITGADYVIGTSNGSASQTFTSWTLGFHSFVEVETGNNTNEWEIWGNIVSSPFTNVGNGNLGKFFKQTLGSFSISFGDGTNGSIPANGARIRVPNIAFIPTTGAAFGTGNPTTTNRVTVAATGGSLLFDRVLLSSLTITLGSPNRINFNKVGCPGGSNIYAPNSCYITNSGFANDTGVTTNSTIFIQVCSDIVVSNSAFVNFLTSGTSTAGITSLVISLCKNINMSNTTVAYIARANIGQNSMSAVGSSGTVNNCRFYGARVNLDSVFNLTFLNTEMADQVTGVTLSSSATNSFNIDSSSDVIFQNINMISHARASILNFNNGCRNIYLINLGTAESPAGTTGSQLQRLVTFANRGVDNLVLKNCWFNSTGTDAYSSLTLSSTYITNSKVLGLQHGSSYNSTIPSTGLQNTLHYGMKCSTIPTSFSGCSRTVWYALFTSSLTGAVGTFFNLADASSGYSVISGNPRFNMVGGLIFNTGDSVLYESPLLYILGFNELNNFTVSGTTVNNLTITYRIDIGNGFSGAYKTLSIENLTGESISPTIGFRIQFLITATGGASTLTRLNVIAITTQELQDAIDYPVTDPVSIEVKGLPSGARCAVYRNSDNTQIINSIAGVSGIITGNFQFPLLSAPIPVTIRARLAGYIPFTASAEITKNGLSIFASMSVDTNYLS